MYTCPLCIQPLDGADRLEVLCPDHVDARFAMSGDDVFPVCPVRDCTSHRRVDGLGLRHIGCQFGKHPFWRGDGATEVPDSVEISEDGRPGSPIERVVRVEHWQRAWLEVAAQVPSAEMWFPAWLLTDGGTPGQRKRNVLVGLSGDKGVGKTFLAMHVLDPDSYCSPKRWQSFGDYFYCYPTNSDAASEFLTTLYMRDVMARNQGSVVALRKSEVRARNIKSVLMPHDFAAPGRGDSGATSGWRAGLGLIRRGMNALSQGVNGTVPTPRALLLYDTAGEESQRLTSPFIRQHDRRVDVVTVLVSALDLSPDAAPATRASVIAANLRLSQVPQILNERPDVRVCVVVTKCDLVPYQEQLARGLHATLAASEHSACRELSDHIRAIEDRVFLLSPDGDPRARQVTKIAGIDALVSWWLNPAAKLN